MADKKMFIMLLKSPWGCEEAKLRITNAMSGDVVLFAQDSVIGASNPPPELKALVEAKAKEGVRFYTSKPDCTARGLSPMPFIKEVDWGEVVDLVLECPLSY